MHGNATARFDNVALLSVASVLPSRVTTSDEIEARLEPSLRRLNLRPGLLRRVAGVHERRNWAAGETVDAATIGDVPRGGVVLGLECHVVDVVSHRAMVSENCLGISRKDTNARWLLTSLPSSSCSGN